MVATPAILKKQIFVDILGKIRTFWTIFLILRFLDISEICGPFKNLFRGKQEIFGYIRRFVDVSWTLWDFWIIAS